MNRSTTRRRRIRYSGRTTHDGGLAHRKRHPGWRVIGLILCGVVVHVASAGRVEAQEGYLYVLVNEPAGIAVVDPYDGEQTEYVHLDNDDPLDLFATPGGKFVFVTHRDSVAVSVIDFESHEQVDTIDSFPATPQRFSFTPQGETLYVGYADRAEVTIFDHRRAEFTQRTQVRLGDAAATIDFNRRATRLYQADDRGLTLYVRKDHEPIRTVRRSAGPKSWTLGPSYRFLWGASADGLFIVDERRARVSKRIDGSFAPHRPLFHDGNAYLLSGGGDAIRVYDDTRFREQGIVQLSQAVDEVVIDETGTLWAIAADERTLYTIVDPLSADARQDEALEFSGTPIALDYITLKSGEGFACFN